MYFPASARGPFLFVSLIMPTDPFPAAAAVSFGKYPIRYHDSGAGQALILLHNGGTSHRIWQSQIPFFARSYRVIALDLLGFGESGRPYEPLTLARYVDMLASLIDQLELEQPILMGNCIGAAMALEYAWQHPGRVAALVLSNVCGGASMMRYFHPFLFPAGRSLPVFAYRVMGYATRWRWVRRQMTARLFGTRTFARDDLYQHLVEAITHPLQPRSRLRLLQGMPSFSKFDQLPPASRLPAPTLICWGERNRVLPLRRGLRLMDALPPTTRIIFPHSGHLPMVEEADRFNQEAAAFLSEQLAQRAGAP